jgi:hypothetical protein
MCILYAFKCRDLSIAYDAADEYVKTHPEHLVTMIVIAHRLKAEGKTEKAQEMIRVLRRKAEALDLEDRTGTLKLMSEFLDVEVKPGPGKDR